MPFDSLPEIPSFPVVQEDEVGITLRNAHQILIRNGWCKGTLYRYGGYHQEYCAVGAIRMALGWTRPSKNPVYYKTIRRLASSLPPEYRYDGRVKRSDIQAVMRWNDAIERNRTEVLAQFEKAQID